MNPEEALAPARLFWAVGVTDAAAVFAESECRRLQPLLPSAKIRWQPRDNWHLTLLFLGESNLRVGLAMADGLRAPLAALPAFTVSLQAAAWFPSQNHPLVVALPVTATPPLLALADVVQEAARAAGFTPEERPFRGHVSLARVSRGYRPRDELPASTASGELRAASLSLYESRREEAGRRYVPLLHLPLGKG